MIRGINIINSTKSFGLNRVQSRKLLSNINYINNNKFLNNNNRSFSTSNNSNNNNNSNNDFNSINNENMIQTTAVLNSGNKTAASKYTVQDIMSSHNASETEAISILDRLKQFPEYVKSSIVEVNESFLSTWFTDKNFVNIDMLNDLHIGGIPWPAIIAGMALTLRVVTLPVTIRTQKVSARMKEVRQEVEKHSYLNDGTVEGRLKMMELQQNIMKQKNVSTLSILGPNLVIFPLLIYPFVVLRQMTEHTTLFDGHSFLWVNSISAPDPLYLLPILSSAFQLLSSRASMQSDTHPLMKGFMYSLGVLPLLFTINFSSALNIYWCTNSFLFLITNLFFRSKFGSKLFNLPYDNPVKQNSKIVVAPTINESQSQSQPQPQSQPINQSRNHDKEMLEQIKSKQDLIEKRKEELALYRRSKK